MLWRKFNNKFFWFLAPKGCFDAAIKVIFILTVIVSSQVFFTLSYLGFLPQTFDYYFWCSIVVGGPWVALFFVIGSFQIGLQKKLSLLSRKDGLTGLNNRRTFFEMANRRNIAKTGGVLLMMDADNFKKVNDTYGHAAGDVCLKAIAYRVGRNLKDDDVAGRLGGEEFAVLLAGSTLHQARSIADLILKPIPFSSPFGDENLTVTLSIGGVEAGNDDTLETLLIRADEALYHAKDAGKARLVIWSPSLEMVREQAC